LHVFTTMVYHYGLPYGDYTGYDPADTASSPEGVYPSGRKQALEWRTCSEANRQEIGPYGDGAIPFAIGVN